MRESQNVEAFSLDTNIRIKKEHGKEKGKEELFTLYNIHTSRNHNFLERTFIMHSINIDYSGSGTVVGAWGSACTSLTVKIKT